jgi:hypothetical protein
MLMLGAVAVGLWSASAAASTRAHLKRTVGPIAFDPRAWAVSDFALHLEESGATAAPDQQVGPGSTTHV